MIEAPAVPAIAPISLAKPADGELNQLRVHNCSSWKQVQTLLFIKLGFAVELQLINNSTSDTNCQTNNPRETTAPIHSAQSSEIRNMKRQQSRLSGRIAAAHAARQFLSRKQDLQPEIVNLPSGQPRFTNLPNLHVSISHSNHMAVACVGRIPCGIDLECIEPRPAALAKYFFSEKEQLQIQRSSDPLNTLHVLWTRKEAVSKLFGKGGQLPFKSLAVLPQETSAHLTSLQIGNYILSLATFPKERSL